MKKMWKNVLGVIAIVAVSVGAAVGTSFYLTNKNLAAHSTYSVESEYGFRQQPFHYAAYNTVAAENIDFTVAAENSIHAVVHIKATTNAQSLGQGRQQYVDPFEFFFGFGGRGQMQPQPRVGAGSGVIISVDGYIMTNNHVIDGADELEVTLNDNRKFPAKVVGTDPQTDIALIKIEAKDLPTIPFGDSDKLKVGEWVLAIGNPFNLTSTVTAGIVSAKGRGGISRGAGRGIESFIQTDAAVNPGNSGGALVNTRGELVGINTAIYSETGNFAGYSFAVPISIAGKVVSDLKEFGVVQRAVLGVMMHDIQHVKEGEKEKLKVTEGAYIAEFAPYSSAKEAGVEVGDVIVAVNGVKIRTGSALQEQISKYRPGDKVKLTVDRYGKKHDFTIELRNSQGNTEVVKSKGDVAEVLGAAFQELSDKQKQQLGLSYGVEVTGVTNGKMKDVGISKGYIIQSINDQRITTPDDIVKIVDRVIKSGGDDQALFIKGLYPNRNGTKLRVVYYAINLAD